MITFSSIQATDFRHVALRILIHKAVSDYILQHYKKSLEFKSLVINIVHGCIFSNISLTVIQ